MDFWHHNMCQYESFDTTYQSIWISNRSEMDFWHHNMSIESLRKWTFDTTIWVASPIYALLSVIRQQMSPFDPFMGGGRQKGTMSPFFTVFFSGERPLVPCLEGKTARISNMSIGTKKLASPLKTLVYRERSEMFGIFGDVKSLVKLDDICIDNNIFRLHYKVSSSTISAALLLYRHHPSSLKYR